MMFDDQKKGYVNGECFANVSIIVAAKNEEKHIEKCIDSLMAQEFIGGFEIIVVDNCSEDKTRELAEGKSVNVYRCEGRSPASVRNCGASLAKYNVLAFIDGDCEAPKDWLTRALENLNNSNVGATGGGCLSPVLSNIIVKSWSPSSVNKNPKRKFGAFLPGSNIIIKKEVFTNLGGFNELLISAEDDDMCKRVLVAGFTIINDDNMKVIHYGYPSTFKGVFLKSIWHGSTQLKAHGLFGDKMVLLTLIWLLCITCSIIFFLFDIYKIYIVLFAITFILPFLLCVVRLKKFSFTDKVKYISTLYFVSLVVLLGRSIGILKELFTVTIEKVTFINLNK